VAAEAPEFVPMLEIPRDDYLTGRWGESLRKAMFLSPSAQTTPTDGGGVCARLIVLCHCGGLSQANRPITCQYRRPLHPGLI
jgi:hypothetical protein